MGNEDKKSRDRSRSPNREGETVDNSIVCKGGKCWTKRDAPPDESSPSSVECEVNLSGEEGVAVRLYMSLSVSPTKRSRSTSSTDSTKSKKQRTKSQPSRKRKKSRSASPEKSKTDKETKTDKSSQSKGKDNKKTEATKTDKKGKGDSREENKKCVGTKNCDLVEVDEYMEATSNFDEQSVEEENKMLGGEQAAYYCQVVDYVEDQEPPAYQTYLSTVYFFLHVLIYMLFRVKKA